MDETGVPPKSYRGHHCSACGDPISPYSRGKCRRCGYVGLKREAPVDLLVVLLASGSLGAAKHYHASLGTVTRWRREIGMMPQERARKPHISNHSQFRARGFAERPLLCIRDLSMPGLAAEFLRRWGSVYRCDDRGRPNAKGTHWRRRFTVLTDEALVATARRLGWSPEIF